MSNKVELIQLLTSKYECFKDRGHILNAYKKCELESILEIATKGYNIDRYSIEPPVPQTYLLLQKRVRDLSIYPILQSENCLQSVNSLTKVSNEIYNVITHNKNDYMYRSYAHLLPNSQRIILYELLMNDNDITEELDYISMDSLECKSYLEAIKSGYPKDTAFNLLKYASPNLHTRLLMAKHELGDIEPILVALKSKRNQEYTILNFVTECCKLHINPNPYLPTLIGNKALNPISLATLIHHTEGDFVPSVNVNFDCDIQYLNHLGYDYEMLNELKSKYRHYFIHFILLEMQALLGIPYETYKHYVSVLNIKLLKCIIAGEDMLSYLEMNIPNSLDSIVDSLYTSNKQELYDRFLMLKLLK